MVCEFKQIWFVNLNRYGFDLKTLCQDTSMGKSIGGFGWSPPPPFLGETPGKMEGGGGSQNNIPEQDCVTIHV